MTEPTSPDAVLEIHSDLSDQLSRFDILWNKIRQSRGMRIVAGLAATVSLSGCLPYFDHYTPVDPVTPDQLNVGGFGDSLVYIAEDHGPGVTNPFIFGGKLTDALGSVGYRASVNAAIGASTADLPDFQGFPGANIEFGALGTNDMHYIPDKGSTNMSLPQAMSNYKAYVEQEIQKGTNGFVFVGINTETIDWGLDQSGPPYNAALEGLADEIETEHPGVHTVYVDWEAIVANNLSYLSNSGPHLTDAGSEAYRQAIVHGVEEVQEELATTTTTTTSSTTSTTSSTTTTSVPPTTTPDTTPDTTVPTTDPTTTTEPALP